MAEWLRSGLQIRARRFDSGSGLQDTFFSLSFSFDFDAPLRGFQPFQCPKSFVLFSCKPRDKEGGMEGAIPSSNKGYENGKAHS